MTTDAYLCCPECGNTDFAEIPITTEVRREYAQQCVNDDCGWVMHP
ncbi:hypothetical protein [Actinoallomurus rhizosphaericola]|nr:hypothetical protein [Actinoallomurus rhizosphaericola]MCO5992672.1 hypothetical protein [Actinoallomurus rhizosphaericola]